MVSRYWEFEEQVQKGNGACGCGGTMWWQEYGGDYVAIGFIGFEEREQDWLWNGNGVVVVMEWN